MRGWVKPMQIRLDLPTRLAAEELARRLGITPGVAVERALVVGLETIETVRHRRELGRPVLLVGEAPNRATAARPKLWLYPAGAATNSGRRMLRFSGLDKAEYLALFERTNLFDRALDQGEWSAPEATKRAIRLKRFLGGRTVVVLGRRVANAISSRAGDAPWFQWFEQAALDSTFRLAVCPHPSGLCRAWNEQRWRDESRAFFRALADERLVRERRGPGAPWPTAPPEAPGPSDAPAGDAPAGAALA